MKEPHLFVKHSNQTNHLENCIYGVCNSFNWGVENKNQKHQTDNQIGDEGAKVVAGLLSTNSTIQVIDLSGLILFKYQNTREQNSS